MQKVILLINKKAKTTAILICCFSLLVAGLQAQAVLECYESLREKGIQFYRAGRYEAAINHYLAALSCPDKPAPQNDKVPGLVKQALDARVRQLEKAQREAQDNYEKAEKAGKEALDNYGKAVNARARAEEEKAKAIANRIAYAGQLALQKGDLSTAFRIAEFVYAYLDSANTAAHQLLLDSYYYNEDRTGAGQKTGESPQFWATTTLSGHRKKITDVAYAHDGQYLATASEDHTVQVWDKGTSTPVYIFSQHQAPAREVSFSNDDRYLASASDDGNLFVWDMESGNLSRTLLKDRQRAGVASVCFSPDSTQILLASGYRDGAVVLWDARTGKTVMQTKNYSQKPITRTAFSPTGKYLAASDMSGAISIWERNAEGRFSPNPSDTINLPDAILSISWSVDEGFIAAALSGSSAVFVIDRDIKAIKKTLAGHTSNVADVAFHPNAGSILASASYDDRAIIWDIEQEDSYLFDINGHSNNLSSLAFSPDGSLLTTASWDKTAREWYGLIDYNTQRLKAHEMAINRLSYLTGKGYLASCSRDGAIALWESSEETWPGPTGIIPLEYPVAGISLSPDGKYLAAAAGENSLLLLNMEEYDGSSLPQWAFPGITDVAFSPDGRFLAVAGWGVSAIYPMEEGSPSFHSPVVLKEAEDTGLSTIRFSPDGLSVLTITEPSSASLLLKNSAQLWDARTGELLRVFKNHEEPLRAAAFSPDGRYIATASEDFTAIVWEAQTGLEKTTLIGHTSYVYSLAFSPDGRHVATGSRDNTAKIWRLETGELLLSLDFKGDVNDILYSADGKSLIAGLQSGEIRIVSVDPRNILNQAERNHNIAQLSPENIKFFRMNEAFEMHEASEGPDSAGIANANPGLSQNPLLYSDNLSLILSFARYFHQQAFLTSDLNQIRPGFFRAVDCYERAIDLEIAGSDSSPDYIFSDMARLYSDLAKKLLINKYFENAYYVVDDYAKAYNPDDEKVKMQMAHCMLFMNELGPALQHYLESPSKNTIIEDLYFFNAQELWKDNDSLQRQVEIVYRLVKGIEEVGLSEAEKLGIAPARYNDISLEELAGQYGIEWAGPGYDVGLRDFETLKYQAEQCYNSAKNAEGFEKALESFTELHKTDTANTYYIEYLSLISFQLGQLYNPADKARALFHLQEDVKWSARLCELAPNSNGYEEDWLSPALMNLAVYQLGHGEFEAAFSNAEAAYQLAPAQAGHQRAYAMSHLLARGFEQTRELLLSLCGEYDYENYQYLHQTFIDKLEELDSLYPGNDDIRRALEFLSSPEEMAGLALTLEGQPAKASLAALLGAEASEQSSNQKNYSAAYQLNEQAIKLYRNLNQAGQEYQYDLAISLGNQSFYALFERKYEEAIALAEEALKTAPGDPGLRYANTNLGHGYLLSGKKSKAMDVYSSYIKGEECLQGETNACLQTLFDDFRELKSQGVCGKEFLEAARELSGGELLEELRKELSCN